MLEEICAVAINFCSEDRRWV